MEQADMILVRIQQARDKIEEETLRASPLSFALHQAIIEAGSVLDDALVVLTHFRQICDEFVPAEPGAKLVIK